MRALKTACWPVVYGEIYGLFDMNRDWARIDLLYVYDGRDVRSVRAVIGDRYPWKAPYCDIRVSAIALEKLEGLGGREGVLFQHVAISVNL